MKFERCPKCRTEATLYSIVVNVFLVIYKGTLGMLSGCAALVADSFHSSADVIASCITMLSVKISSKPADADHSFGHGKIQFISSSIVGTILVIGALFIMIGALKDIINDNYAAPDRIAILGAAISVICNELMFRYQSCVARENESPAILANAWDNRSDALSSIAVLIGIILATFGYPIADPLAAIGVSLLVIRIGFTLISESIGGLMDASAETEDLRELYQITRKIAGVLGITYLRARTMGDGLHVEINVQVDGALKIYEGDLIVDALSRKISQSFSHIAAVQIFLTPWSRHQST